MTTGQISPMQYRGSGYRTDLHNELIVSSDHPHFFQKYVLIFYLGMKYPEKRRKNKGGEASRPSVDERAPRKATHQATDSTGKSHAGVSSTEGVNLSFLDESDNISASIDENSLLGLLPTAVPPPTSETSILATVRYESKFQLQGPNSDLL